MSGKMTNYQCNKFLTLLMGECWHEWKKIYLTNGHTVNSNPTLVCKYCDIARVGDDNPDHLANPLVAIRWMEKEMPRVFEDYCIESRYDNAAKNYISETHIFLFILDLRNLCAWLVEHDGWGEKKCWRCLGLGRVQYYMEECPACNGSGKIIHPALEYYLETKGEK